MDALVKTVSDLAPESQALAREAAEHIRGLQQKVVADIAEIGRTLLKVKEAVGHGNFGPWLQDEFQWTERTAQNYISVAERFGSNPKRVSHLPLRTVYKLAAPNTPDLVRENIVERLERGEAIAPSDIESEINSAKRKAEREAELQRQLEKLSPAGRKMEQEKREREKAAQQAQIEKLDAQRARYFAAHDDAVALIISKFSADGLARLLELMAINGPFGRMRITLDDLAGAIALRQLPVASSRV